MFTFTCDFTAVSFFEEVLSACLWSVWGILSRVFHYSPYVYVSVCVLSKDWGRQEGEA